MIRRSSSNSSCGSCVRRRRRGGRDFCKERKEGRKKGFLFFFSPSFWTFYDALLYDGLIDFH